MTKAGWLRRSHVSRPLIGGSQDESLEGGAPAPRSSYLAALPLMRGEEGVTGVGCALFFCVYAANQPRIVRAYAALSTSGWLTP